MPRARPRPARGGRARRRARPDADRPVGADRPLPAPSPSRASPSSPSWRTPRLGHTWAFYVLQHCHDDPAGALSANTSFGGCPCCRSCSPATTTRRTCSR
ncbi:hypothetical protein LT493_08350 [Streptomyces tricolor]|nr:hypothetical protein [Streptomyces tricolor]